MSWWNPLNLLGILPPGPPVPPIPTPTPIPGKLWPPGYVEVPGCVDCGCGPGLPCCEGVSGLPNQVLWTVTARDQTCQCLHGYSMLLPFNDRPCTEFGGTGIGWEQANQNPAACGVTPNFRSYTGVWCCILPALTHWTSSFEIGEVQGSVYRSLLMGMGTPDGVECVPYRLEDVISRCRPLFVQFRGVRPYLVTNDTSTGQVTCERICGLVDVTITAA